MYLEDQLNSDASIGKSNDVELMQSSGIRNRRQVQSRSTSPRSATLNSGDQQVGLGGSYQTQTFDDNQPVVVEHHQPQTSNTQDGGWIARIAALLVGEDPTQSYALICGNCYMHNGKGAIFDFFWFMSFCIRSCLYLLLSTYFLSGLARREDFPFITYYCPHCRALNKPKQLDERNSSLTSPNTGTPKTDNSSTDAVKNIRPSTAESIIAGSSPGSASSSEIGEVTERASVDEKVD